MLAAQIMGSHGGRQNLPFGYDPNEIQGIGLPDFSIPGPPPGQPLLNERDTERMDQFFTAFDDGPVRNSHNALPQYVEAVSEPYAWTMPPTLVRSEVSLRNPPHRDWNQQQQQQQQQHHHVMNAYGYGSDVNNMSGMAQHIHNFDHQTPYPQFFDPSHNIQQTQHHMNYAYGQTWPQPFQDHGINHTRPDMSFGTDPNFRAGGYTGPPIDGDMSLMPYSFEAHSTASNTQPNTQPNTEPSSPSVNKRRRLNEYPHNIDTNGHLPMQSVHYPSQPSPPTSNSRRRKKSFGRNEQPPTPLSKPQTPQEQESDNEEDADAEYDDDAGVDQTRSASPSTPWSATKPRSGRLDRPTSSGKASKGRRKSMSITSPIKTRPKASRASMSSNGPSARIPLSAEQKKANHTNSEQRRRDATAKAYAELYDLVPELNEHGKQSTMKKLEIVVDKVQSVKNQLRNMRLRLGLDPDTGVRSGDLQSWQ